MEWLSNVPLLGGIWILADQGEKNDLLAWW